MDDAGPRLHASRDPDVSSVAVDLPIKPASKGDLIPAFVDAILNDRNINSDTESHFEVMSVIAACDVSLKMSSATEVTYI